MPNKKTIDIMDHATLLKEARSIGLVRYTGRGTKMTVSVYFVHQVKIWFMENQIPRVGYWETFFEKLDQEIVVGSRVNRFLWDLAREIKYTDRMFI